MLSATLAPAAGAAGCSGVREAGTSAGRDRRGVVPRWLDCVRFFAIDVTQSFSVVGTRCSDIERVIEDPCNECPAVSFTRMRRTAVVRVSLSSALTGMLTMRSRAGTGNSRGGRGSYRSVAALCRAERQARHLLRAEHRKQAHIQP